MPPSLLFHLSGAPARVSGEGHHDESQLGRLDVGGSKAEGREHRREENGAGPRHLGGEPFGLVWKSGVAVGGSFWGCFLVYLKSCFSFLGFSSFFL